MGISVLLFLCLFWLLNKVDSLKSILIIICNPIYLHNVTYFKVKQDIKQEKKYGTTLSIGN